MLLVVCNLKEQFGADPLSSINEAIEAAIAAEVVIAIHVDHFVRSFFDSTNLFAEFLRKMNKYWAAVVKERSNDGTVHVMKLGLAHVRSDFSKKVKKNLLKRSTNPQLHFLLLCLKNDEIAEGCQRDKSVGRKDAV